MRRKLLIAGTLLTALGLAPSFASACPTTITVASGDAVFNTPFVLTCDTTVTASGGNVVFQSTVDGAYNLTVNTSGTTTFGGAVGGSTALASLTTDASGSTTLGGNVTTTGSQQFNDSVVLVGDTTVTASAGGVVFESTVNGAYNLTVNSSGTTSFSSPVGSTVLASLTTDAGGSTTLGGQIITTGAQQFNDSVMLLDYTNLISMNNGAISFASSVDGNQVLQVSTGGAITFLGPVGDSIPLAYLITGPSGTTTLGGNISTTHTQQFSDPVLLAGDTNLISLNSGAISFDSSVDGAHALMVSTSGTTTFGGTVGGSTALASLTTNPGGTTTLGGGVFTTGGQHFNDAVMITGNTILESMNSGTITFGSSVDGAYALEVHTNGQLTFDAPVGGATWLASLTTDSGSLNLATLNVSGNLAVTSGSAIVQTSGAYTVGGTSTFNAGSNTITLTSFSNVFQDAVSLSGGSAQIDNSANLILGASNLTGDLTAVSGGAISQSAALNLSGAAAFSTFGGVITLANPGNNFGGAVSLSGGPAQITDMNALTLGTCNTGALSAVSAGALDLGSGSVSGDLAAISNGAITQSGPLAISGTSTLNAGSGSIALTDANNAFSGAVTLSSSGASPVALNGGSQALLLGNVSAGSGALSLSAPTVSEAGALGFGNGSISGTVNGNYTQTQNGAVNLHATPSSNDSLLVSGSASLGGALSVAFNAPPADGQSFTVLTATAVSGSFSAFNVSGLAAGQVANLSYTDTSAVLTITVPTAPHSIGGSINGLAGSGLSLQLTYGSASESLNIANGASTFAFTAGVFSRTSYNVSVTTQPGNPSQTCSVSGGSGTMPASNVTSVVVSCTTNRYSIGGSINGLTGTGLALQLNGASAVPASGSSFTFASSPLASGSSYIVGISAQPAAQTCSIANASGTVTNADVTSVVVDCVPAVPQLSLSVDDGHTHARYGNVLDYIVTLTNSGDATATDVAVSSTLSAGLDGAQARWQCYGGGSGAACTASASGPLADSATVPPGRTLTWLVSVPVVLDAIGDTVTMDISAPNASTVSDVDTLVLFRDTFDVADADGTQAVDPRANAADVLTSGASIGFDIAAATGNRINVLQRLRSGTGEVRVERLDLGTLSFVRLLARDANGREHASEWATTQAGARLSIASVRGAAQQRIVLLEGASPSLQLTIAP